MKREFFKHISDDELIILRRHGDEYSSNLLVKKYKKYALKIANINYFNNKSLSISIDEYYSVAMHCFLLAFKNYKTGENMFKAYWEKITANEINHYIINRCKSKNILSLDMIFNDGDGMPFSEMVGKLDFNIIEDIHVKEINQILSSDSNSILSNEERTVIIGKIFDSDTKTLAKKLNKTQKHINYVYSKAKNKLGFLKK